MFLEWRDVDLDADEFLADRAGFVHQDAAGHRDTDVLACLGGLGQLIEPAGDIEDVSEHLIGPIETH